MKLIMEEYGGMLVGIAGTSAMLALLVTFFAEQGQIYELINYWMMGGC